MNVLFEVQKAVFEANATKPRPIKRVILSDQKFAQAVEEYNTWRKANSVPTLPDNAILGPITITIGGYEVVLQPASSIELELIEHGQI